MIRRRQVFYVEGYDPQGAVGYHRMFGRSWKRCRGAWGFEGKVGELVLDSDWLAHWNIETAGPNWQVTTRYEFLRLEAIVAKNMAQPIWRQIPRALAWIAGDLVNGTLLRIFRAEWRFGVHLLYFEGLLLLWLALSAAGGWLAGMAAARFAGVPTPGTIAVGIAGALFVFWSLRPLANRLQVVQINDAWPTQRAFARGEASAFDHPTEVCAARIVAAARAADCDEIVVVGHSGGAAFACTIMARALELDPQLGRHGPQMVLLTLGSIMPALALHPSSQRLRDCIRRIAIEPSVNWIDCVSRKDVMNFSNFDVVAGLGIDAGEKRCNPLTWQVRFKEAVSPEYYRRLRTSFFRLHYQFILGGDRRSPFDYLMLVMSPLAIVDWAKCPPTSVT